MSNQCRKSDIAPLPGSVRTEALGRMVNGLAAAYDFGIYFQGTGTRWPGVLAETGHPLHALYRAVQGRVVEVSCGCADAFGAREEVEKAGFDLITDDSAPGTSGLPGIAQIAADGYTVFTF